MKRAFTLVELVVSVGVLIILLVIVSMIFKMAVDASGKATANNQVMVNLRTIEQQLRQDVSCIHRDSFLGISYRRINIEKDPGEDPIWIRFDRMAFFMCGPPDAYNFAINFDDSESINVIITEVPIDSPGSIPMREHVGRIHWGHSLPMDANILARRQKLMVPRLEPISAPASNANEWYDFHDAETFGDQFDRFHREDLFDLSAFFDASDVCLTCDSKYYGWLRRPVIFKDVGRHLRLGNGCLEFSVQRWRNNRWYPGDSDFDREGDEIHEYWNGPRTNQQCPEFLDVSPVDCYANNDWMWYRRSDFPGVFKITITLIDKHRRLLPQTFTMIVESWSKK